MMAKRFVQTGGYIMNSGAVAAANTQQLKLRTTCYHLTAPEEPEPWLIDSEMTRALYGCVPRPVQARGDSMEMGQAGNIHSGQNVLKVKPRTVAPTFRTFSAYRTQSRTPGPLWCPRLKAKSPSIRIVSKRSHGGPVFFVSRTRDCLVARIE